MHRYWAPIGREKLLYKSILVSAIMVFSAGLQAGNWDQFHGNRLKSGMVRDSIFSGTNAGALTIRWQANTGSQVWSSPVAKFYPDINKTLVFVGNNAGVFSAYDAATGDRIWYYKAGSGISSTAALWGKHVWVGSQDHYLRRFEATTGKLNCQFHSDGAITSAPVIADPDGSGPNRAMVYFGDNGLNGADDGGFLGAIDERTCQEKWRFAAYGDPAGSVPLAGTWSPVSFAPAVNGEHPALVVFGGSSPDNAVYAVNANTGSLVWRLQTSTPGTDLDVGAAPAIGAINSKATPGGIAYVSAKDSIMRAIELSTGQEIWKFENYLDTPGSYKVRSTVALARNMEVYGYGQGLFALDGSGKKLWSTGGLGMADVLSSPAMSWPNSLGSNTSDSVIFFGDVAGKFFAVDGAGQLKWSYATAGPIFSSPAIMRDRVYVGSSDGFLYAFGFGGGVSAPPDTAITFPEPNSSVPNTWPTAPLKVTGTASDDVAVANVLVAIKNRSTGKWWDDSTKSWTSIFTETEATLDNPGGKSTNWETKVPLTMDGGNFLVQAEARDSDRQHDSLVSQVSFNVPTQGNPPAATVTNPATGYSLISYFPNGREPYIFTVTGTAEDTKGAHPGIEKVLVQIRNTDHNEYYCGTKGCPDAPTAPDPEDTENKWRPKGTVLQAKLANPGATSTTWSIEFPVYDHPHNYRINVRPVDLDGEQSQAWIQSGKLCVRDPGPVTDCYGPKQE